MLRAGKRIRFALEPGTKGVTGGTLTSSNRW